MILLMPIAEYKKRGAIQKRFHSSDMVQHIHATTFFPLMDSIVNRKSTGRKKASIIENKASKIDNCIWNCVEPMQEGYIIQK